jgi:hypothetical protein
MTPRKRPTPQDRVQAIRIAVCGMGSGVDPGDLRLELSPLHPKNNTFPGEVLLKLAADAMEEAGALREEPIEFEDLRERYLPECTAHTNAQHQHSKYALRAAAMIRAGVDPGLLDEVTGGRATTCGSGRSTRSRCTCAWRPITLGARSAKSARCSRSGMASISARRTDPPSHARTRTEHRRRAPNTRVTRALAYGSSPTPRRISGCRMRNARPAVSRVGCHASRSSSGWPSGVGS